MICRVATHPVAGGQRGLVVGEHLRQHLADPLLELGVAAGGVVQLRAEQVQQGLVGAAAHVGERVVDLPLPAPADRRVEQRVSEPPRPSWPPS